MISEDSKINSLRLGHRARVRARLLRKGGPSMLADYELLEALLFTSIPRRDVRDLAKNLLYQCGGNISGVLWAEKEHLARIEGLGEASIAMFICVRSLLERALLDNVRSRSVLNNWKDVINYLRMTTRVKSTEHLRVLYLNHKNHLVGNYLTSHGTIDKVAIYNREIIKTALHLGASSIIISHNHTGGDPNPSNADIVATRKLRDSCGAMDIRLVDHIIISHDDYFSFQENNMI